VASVLALAATGGCVGEIGGGGADDPTGESPEELCKRLGPTPGAMPRLVRLTHKQYDATIKDLFGMDLQASASFIGDPTFSGFSNNAAGLLVSERLARDYRRAAESIAETVFADPAAVARVVTCTPTGDGEACAREVIRTFGRRVYRRAISKTIEDAYVTLFRHGNDAYASGSAFDKGMRLVIEGMLQSPNFLYRVELSEKLDKDKFIALDGYEVATRLSYLLWNSTPDEALLKAAEDGKLDTPQGVEAQARRLLADDRAMDPIADFHDQWLMVSKYENVQKNATLYPTWDSVEMADDMKEETRRFIRRVVFEQESDFAALMTSSTSFVNDRLAPLYGVEGTFGPDLVETELDPKQRAGLLTQIGFLASRAYPDKASPIHRGVFVQRQILCAELPDPPGDIDTTLPPFEGEIHTTRDAVEVHTSPETCQNCHGFINPPGFALDSYDSVGAWRTTENGYPLDTSAEVLLGDKIVEVDGSIDLIKELSRSPVAEKCYVRQWFRYGNQRADDAIDQCTVDALDKEMQGAGYNVKELLVALTQTKTFRYRAVEKDQ
jgi:hypothetical protein